MDCGSWGRVISGPTSSCIQCSQMCRAASTGGHLNSSSPPCVHHSIRDLKRPLVCVGSSFLSPPPDLIFLATLLSRSLTYTISSNHTKEQKREKKKKCWYSGGTLKVVVGDHERTHKSREAINVMCVRLEGVKKEGKEASYISRAQAIISQHTHAAQVYCIVWKCVAWSQSTQNR